MQNTIPIRYRILPHSPEAHLFEVSCTVSAPEPEGQRFALPVWIPGSYLVREFSRHVVEIRAASGRKPLTITKCDKHTWQVEPTRAAVTVTMQVYAWDLSVRGAHLDTSHAFFNGPSVFLRVLGQETRPCEVEIQRPVGARYRSWRVATSLLRSGAPPYGFGSYAAADYDELIDHPVEMGTFALVSFEGGGVSHDAVITGRHNCDLDRLAKDLSRLCTWQIDFFGRPAPMQRYVFLVTAIGEGYGGLEHRASSALLCNRDDLPQPGVEAIHDGYRTFLGLCSHEYFHTWNVKRIKPQAFTPYDLDRESYTTLLWAFEGITSYYDDLALVRSGLISHSTYLEMLGRSITSHLRTGGRFRQTVTESSFDAWIKYYRQDENSPNAIVSYYLKGSLIALCLDLLIRHKTGGRRSLDEVMRSLWKQYGLTGSGVGERDWEALAERVTGVRLRNFFERALRSTEELPFRQLLATVGIEMHVRAADSASDRGGRTATSNAAQNVLRVTLGARTAEGANGVKLTHVLDGGAAQSAGLAAGDVLVALDGLRVDARNLEQRMRAMRPGQKVRAHAFRRDELIESILLLQAPPPDTCYLEVTDKDVVRRRGRERWLGKER